MMKQLNSIEKVEYINSNLKRYIKSTFQLDNLELNEQFNRSIDEEQLTKGPYISGRKPFTSGKSIEDLIEEGILNQAFYKMPELKIERPLYKHQEEAIRKSHQGKNLVISTGTGSGKTESFLIPILDRISRDIDAGKTNRGVQALLLYPLNALANDQRGRVRDILDGYPEISFGFFTGETEEKEDKANTIYHNEFGRRPSINEIISREKIRETPPNILFTNYSMLEYLLIRPNDQSIFSQEHTSLWRYIVLDEAHTYRGSLGIEISYLMRRLLGTISSKPNFILTSATLAGDERDFPSVIDFAEKLTSQKFDMDSIVISKFEEFIVPEVLLDSNPKIYSNLLENSFVDSFYAEHFPNVSSSSSVDKLRTIITHQKDFYKFAEFLDTPKDVRSLLKDLGIRWNGESLTVFMDLLAKINSEHEKLLFDVRYHSFVKTLDGAYISLKPKKKMILKKTTEIRYGNTGDEDIVKALQLGLCKSCNIPYVLGRIHDDHFYQIDDEEIYEVYGDEHKRVVDILLVKEFVNADDIDMENKIEYSLCNKCGHIVDNDRINVSGCNCGDEYLVELIGNGKKSGDSYKTNISKCLSCNSVSVTGIVKSFYVGKDSATAILGQLLIKSMEREEKTKPLQIKFNPFTTAEKLPVSEERYIKQFIAFSDSRQQASFFSTFFKETHVRFLRSKLLLDALSNSSKVPVANLESKIQIMIEKKELFPNDIDFNRQGWITLLREILDIDRKFSLGGLGLISFDYDVQIDREIEGMLKNAITEKGIDLKLKDNDFYQVLKFILNSMRNIPGVHYSHMVSLEKDKREAYFSYRQDNRSGIVFENAGKEKFNRSIKPYNSRGNIYTSYIERSFGLSSEAAIEFLTLVWNYLSTLLHSNAEGNSKTLDVDKIYATDGLLVDWYRCSKCRTITDININNTCVKKDCEGKLTRVEISEISKDNFYVREYRNKTIEKLIVKEHTAQIDREAARKIQNDFKAGKINVISSSTTFEMGVDVGSLDTVFMRNVPPTPANYVQRAGRAGRSKHTAAFAITFASNSSHDYTFFQNPLKMIAGKIKAPYFNTTNNKIAGRHILSYALSLYFKENPEQFSKSDLAISEETYNEFSQFVSSNRNSITNFVVENDIDPKFDANFELWFQEHIDKASKLDFMFKDYRKKIAQLNEGLKNKQENEEYTGHYYHNLREMEKASILTLLPRYSVIPSYGFPVDTVKLEIPSAKSKYDLNRDLSSAISEYAPGSEVIVDDKKFRSRYLNLNGKESLKNHYYVKCEKCKSLTYSFHEKDPNLECCQNCESSEVSRVGRFVIPVNGFISEFNDLKDKTIKPKKSYRSDYFYVGSSEGYQEEILVGDVLTLKSSRDTQLAMLNESGFVTCETCGYTEVSQDLGFKTDMVKHTQPASTYSCKNEVLVRKSLGHTFVTDIVMLGISAKEFTYDEMLSFMYALLEGISISLEIERNDINGIVQQIDGELKILFFDNVPGGAGHVKRLLNKEILLEVLKQTHIKVSQECCDESASCYNCIRNYNNQKVHPKLKRGFAKKVVEELKLFINKGTPSKDYSIDDSMYERNTWEFLNSEFDNAFEYFETRDLETCDYVYSTLEVGNKKIDTILIWEDKKIAVVEDVVKVDDIAGWTLYTMDQFHNIALRLGE